ncbi:MAG: 2-C-methyl-D-erythritol 4-phosphate cytidylyltransferase [Spirochaetales bacterium]|nr:2-C-methyl-D-erythritol 4-phosphate cytidylyltransferase [Spirochaetales bacterium]
MRHAVIVTAAGSSRRFNGSGQISKKKEFLCISGEPVLCRAIRPFLATEDLVALVVTYRKGDLEEVKGIVSSLDLNGIEVLFVEGGDTRQASVFNGLKVLYDRRKELDVFIVSIHDGARPFISENKLVKSCIDMAQKVGGACPCLRVTDTLVKVGEDGLLDGRLSRDGVCTVQTPQSFRFPEIYHAHCSAVPGKAYTDDTEVFMDWGGRVGFVQGDPNNRKITFAGDLKENS